MRPHAIAEKFHFLFGHAEPPNQSFIFKAISMAKMIPDFGPAETDSYREPLVYNQLKAQLPNDFTVIHSLPWLAAATQQLSGERKPPTGEIDFLILHPQLGVLALEVKGGTYRIQGAAFVLIRTGQRVGVVRQTRNNSHGLARWLTGNNSMSAPIGYAFCFPDSHFSVDALPPAMRDPGTGGPHSLMLDMGAMPKLGRRVIEIMTYWANKLRIDPLGEQKVSELIKALCPDFDGTPQWGLKVLYDSHFWLRLTPEQIEVTNYILSREKNVVTGWPGTGKTLIGVEAARRFCRGRRKVLVVTFNALLSEYWAKQLTETDCAVLTWHKLCRIARSRRNRPALDDDQFREWGKDECAKDLSAALDAGLLDHYDVLILDEAQALKPDWCALLFKWFAKKQIAVFCDETQVFPFEKEPTTLESISTMLGGVVPFHLSVVMRMPRAVTDRLREVRESHIQLSTPRMLEADTVREMVVDGWDAVLPTIVGALFEQGVAPSDITVLARYGFDRLPKSVLDFLIEYDDIPVEAVSRFRGMESPVVLIINAEELNDTELFCAYSRATTICMSFFDAELLSVSAAGRFLEKVLTESTNQSVLSGIQHRLHPRTMLATHRTKKLDIKTIGVSWCYSMKCWFIPSIENSHLMFWANHLVREFSWPVVAWSEFAQRKIKYYTADTNDDMSGVGLTLEFCEECEKNTPIDYSSKECSVCTGELSHPRDELMNREVKNLVAWDNLIQDILKAPSWDELLQRRNELPFYLATVAIGEYALLHNRRPELFDGYPDAGGSWFYRTAIVQVTAWLMMAHARQEFGLSDIASETYHSWLAERGVNGAKWRHYVAMVIDLHRKDERITPVRKGFYILK